MPGEQPSNALTDSAIDQELGSMLAVDPSPAFVARVRARVAHESASASGLRYWISRTAAVVAILVLASTFLERTPPARPPVTAPGATPDRTSAAPVRRHEARDMNPEPSPAQTLRPNAPRPHREASAVGRRPIEVESEPEVLVSAAESEALRQLLAAGSAGRVRITRWPDPPTQAARLSVSPIVVPALVIEPLRPEGGT